MIMRAIDTNIFQSDFEYANLNHHKYDVVISVAREHDYPWNTLHIPQIDLMPLDFWDLLRVTALTHVEMGYNKKVLIYCHAGASRSVAYSIAYLVSKGVRLDTAKKMMGVDLLHASMENSLKLFEQRMQDLFFQKLFRYALIQMEALQNDSPVPEERVVTTQRYVNPGAKILILGCTSTEYDAFGKLYNAECVHLNPLGKVGKFMMFEYNEFKDNYFDAVLAFDTLEHMFTPFITIGEIRRVLKEGGIFYHSTPTIHQSMKIPWHVSLFSADSWKWILDWWDFKVLEERITEDRITQVLRKEKFSKFESYHRLVQIF